MGKKVTVVGAGFYGSTTAQRLAEYDIFDTVVLTDIIVVSNPLDEMTALTQLATQFPKNRVMGQAGMLDSARFTNFVAEELKVPVRDVRTLTLGSHGDTMVPVPSQSTVNGKPLTELLPADKIEELVTRTRNGGAEVVALLKTGSA